MIVKILPSSSNFHAVDYNEKKVEEGTAVLLEAKNIPDYILQGGSAEDLKQYMVDYSARNDRIRNPQFHVAFSCKGREMTEAEILDFAHQWLAEMGYDKPGQPLLVYAHRDTDNTHIHVITSRVNPNGKKIDHNHERRRSQKAIDKILGVNKSEEINDAIKQALEYTFSSVGQFKAILESLGYECYEKDAETINIKKGGNVEGEVKIADIKAKLRKVEPDKKRNRQLWALLNKYKKICGSRDELAAMMKTKFGVSLVFLGSKDKPYGYFIVDHSRKRVLNGGEVMKIKELQNFPTKEERFRLIDTTVAELLVDHHYSTRELNGILKRQFNAKIKQGCIVLGEDSVELSPTIREQLRHNNKAEWLQKFHPKTEMDRNALCDIFKFEDPDWVEVDSSGTHSERAEYELCEIFAQGGDVRFKLDEAGYRVFNRDGVYYAVDVKNQTITNLNELGVNVNKLREVSVNRSPLNKINSHTLHAHGHKRDWEVGPARLDEEDERRGMQL